MEKKIEIFVTDDKENPGKEKLDVNFKGMTEFEAMGILRAIEKMLWLKFSCRNIKKS